MLPFPHSSGALLLPSLVPQEFCAHWLTLIEHRYATLDAEALIASGDYSPHSSSLRLRALPQISVGAVWAELRRNPEFLATVHHALGPRISCAVDECWIRRQYAPGRYPPLHAAHSWHQDGALGFDFLASDPRPAPTNAPLEMLTCWLPLMPCGNDAPGLELIARRQESLLAPVDLTQAQMSLRFAEVERWRPRMGVGDALLFCGDLLHRTGITAGMSRDRVSIELRFFPSNGRPVPQQLRPLVD
ncbi:MAG: phytanoyl-CoA dioxygenase family protein [Burkholderiaceae bacterium]|nr:phytanoyl-CoA dioxygenase family protein [Burkholderiaceae bacterium]